jgi:prepilin-type processing-associated H-X9-DG protein
MLSLVVIPTGVLILSQSARDYERPFLAGYLIYFLVVIVVTMWVVSVRLKRQSGRTPIAAIIGISLLLLLVIGLSLPAVPAAREAARRMQCSNNVKQILLSMQNYSERNRYFPLVMGAGPNGDPVSWRVSLLPFLERNDLYERYDQGQPWDSPHNEPLQHRTGGPIVYSCPSDPSSIPHARSSAGAESSQSSLLFTAYTIPTGDGALSNQFHLRKDQLPERYSRKLAVLEACGQKIVWSEPRDVELSDDTLGVNLDGDQPGRSRGIMSSYHAGGVTAGYLDGSVRFMSKDVDEEVLRQLMDPDAEYNELP